MPLLNPCLENQNPNFICLRCFWDFITRYFLKNGSISEKYFFNIFLDVTLSFILSPFKMKELSAASQTQTASIANPAEESARQRRSAERDGRRRRRMQHRATSQKSIRVQHFEGLSSDDEISSLDQANLGKSR